MDKTSSMYLYVKLNWDANRFLPAESKDCMNSASYEYRNMSARRGAQFVPMGIVISWVYYTIPFGFSFFRHILGIIFNFFNYFLFWLRITVEGSLPVMRIWSILLIKSDLKWCIHLSRCLYLYFNHLVSVTAGGPSSPRGYM